MAKRAGSDRVRSMESVAQFWRDHVWAARRLAKNRVFTVVVALTLGLAIGGNAAIYSVVSAVLIQPLPYPHPEQLVRVYTHRPGFPDLPVTPADFHQFRDDSPIFANIAGFFREGHEFQGSAGPENLEGLFVSAGYFELLGARVALGRTFTRQDEQPGNADRVVLSDRIWRTRLGADPSIVGRTINLSRRPFEVVGVIAPGLEHVGGAQRSLPHGETADFWIPLTFNTASLSRTQRTLNTIGRLATCGLAATGERRARPAVATAGRALSRYPRRLADDGDAARRRDRRPGAAGAARDPRRRRVRPARCQRQRRLPDARPIDRANPRARDARRARRQPVAPGARDSRRVVAAGAPRRAASASLSPSSASAPSSSWRRRISRVCTRSVSTPAWSSSASRLRSRRASCAVCCRRGTDRGRTSNTRCARTAGLAGQARAASSGTARWSSCSSRCASPSS